MLQNFLFFLSIFAILVSPGCSHNQSHKAWPEPRPLGKDMVVYRPPVEPNHMDSDAYYNKDPNGIITLRKALSLALLYNPELKVFSRQVRVAEAKTLQAGLMPNPKIGVVMEGFGGRGERNGFDGAETTLQLGQLIELAGKRQKRAHLATLESELTGWNYESKRLDVLTQVGRAFINVLAAQKHLMLKEKRVYTSEKVNADVSQRVQAGKNSPLEEIKARVILANVRMDLAQAKRTWESARKQLSATWAGTTLVFDHVSGQFEQVSPVPPITQLTPLLSQNPDLARWTVEHRQRQATLKLEDAQAIPDPFVFGGPRYFNDTDDTAFILGLSMALPINNRNQGNILAAKHKLIMAGDEHQAAQSAVFAALAEAYQRFSNTFIAVTTLSQEILPAAQNAFDAARHGYQEGKFNYLDVLDAQRTLFESQGLYIDSLTAYHIARIDVERLIAQDIHSINDSTIPSKKGQESW